ncbi:hypothetical protein V5R04_06835 [Jonesiaceae bacterium BS-20]|uniref:Uncharacterized protein n=1 Tax=Jonesiaceae bacterium BS-20 TaxID=3120821 RepID=A0AAU7DY34_9MICO
MYRGNAKADEKDVFINADAAITLLYTLHALEVSEQDEATLGRLTEFDLDQIRNIKQAANWIHG